MARIQSHTIKIDPSPDQDVVKYRVYVSKGETANPYEDIMVETTSLEVIAPDDFPDGTFDEEGTYVIQATAVDGQGNESDPMVINHFFDLTPPRPPAGLSVI